MFVYMCVSTRTFKPHAFDRVFSNNLFAHCWNTWHQLQQTETHQHVKCSHSVKHLFSASAWTRGSINPKMVLHWIFCIFTCHCIFWHLALHFKWLCQQLHSLSSPFHFIIWKQAQRPSLGTPDCKCPNVPRIQALSKNLYLENLPGSTMRRLASPTCLQKGNRRSLQVSRGVVARCWCWRIL